MADARVWVVTFGLTGLDFVVPIGAFTTKDKLVDFIIDFLENIRDEYLIDMPTKEYLLENSHRFDNVRISATGRVSATPSQVDWNSFETHYEYAFCERYKDMPNRNQIKIYQEYSDNLKLGDILIKKYPQLTRELIMYRGDIFSSDREVASMAYSIRNMIF